MLLVRLSGLALGLALLLYGVYCALVAQVQLPTFSGYDGGRLLELSGLVALFCGLGISCLGLVLGFAMFANLSRYPPRELRFELLAKRSLWMLGLCLVLAFTAASAGWEGVYRGVFVKPTEAELKYSPSAIE